MCAVKIQLNITEQVWYEPSRTIAWHLKSSIDFYFENTVSEVLLLIVSSFTLDKPATRCFGFMWL